jgi:hypothetical protein
MSHHTFPLLIPCPQVSMKDHTGSQLVSMFDDQAAQLLGHSADEL